MQLKVHLLAKVTQQFLLLAAPSTVGSGKQNQLQTGMAGEHAGATTTSVHAIDAAYLGASARDGGSTTKARTSTDAEGDTGEARPEGRRMEQHLDKVRTTASGS